MNIKIEAKKAFMWKDKKALQKLIDHKVLIPIPKHSFCNPGECFKCAWKDCDWKNRAFLLIDKYLMLS